MRFILILFVLTLPIDAAFGLTAKTSCGDRLHQVMSKDENGDGECEVEVSDGQRTVKKRFTAEMVDGGPDGAQILMREFCDHCKTEGKVYLHAVDFAKVARWSAEHAARELNNEPDPESLTNDCFTSNDAIPISEDMMTCRLGALRDVKGTNAAETYFGKWIQPRLQQLALRSDRDAQTLLRRSLTTIVGLPVVQSSPMIGESMRQYDLYNRTFDQATEVEQGLRATARQPEDRRRLNETWQRVKGEAIAIFSNRSKVLRESGVTDAALLGNSDLLAKAVKNLGDASGVTPGTAPPTPGSNPRAMFGTPVQGRGIPGGITPPQQRRGTNIFHAN